ncbi:MAG: hypothetical protein Q9215_002523 [Flavoplaca cf. flavocitrina]
MSSAEEGSSQQQESFKMENGELGQYNSGTLDEMHRLNQLIDASTEREAQIHHTEQAQLGIQQEPDVMMLQDYSLPNQTMTGRTSEMTPMSQKRRVSTSDSPRDIVDDIEDNQNPLAYGRVLSSRPNGTGIDPSSADERLRALQRRLLSSVATDPERQLGPSTLPYGNNQPHRGHLNPPDSPQWVPIPLGQTTTPSMPYENTTGTENPGYGNAESETDPGMTQPQASHLHNAENAPLLRFQGTYITIPPEQQIPSHSTVQLPQFNHQEQHQGVQPDLDTDGGMAANFGHPATPTIQDMPAHPVQPQANQYQLLAQQQQRFITNSREIYRRLRRSQIEGLENQVTHLQKIFEVHVNYTDVHMRKQELLTTEIQDVDTRLQRLRAGPLPPHQYLQRDRRPTISRLRNRLAGLWTCLGEHRHWTRFHWGEQGRLAATIPRLEVWLRQLREELTGFGGE